MGRQRGVSEEGRGAEEGARGAGGRMGAVEPALGPTGKRCLFAWTRHGRALSTGGAP